LLSRTGSSSETETTLREALQLGQHNLDKAQLELTKTKAVAAALEESVSALTKSNESLQLSLQASVFDKEGLESALTAKDLRVKTLEKDMENAVSEVEDYVSATISENALLKETVQTLTLSQAELDRMVAELKAEVALKTATVGSSNAVTIVALESELETGSKRIEYLTESIEVLYTPPYAV
jgi:chromosome segregation ATPase